MDRRGFMKDSALSIVALAGGTACAAPATRHPQAVDRVTLGRSGLVASRQSIGLGDGKGDAFQKMGQSGFTRMIRHMLDRGARYFDLLPGPAHEMLAKALKGVPRETYTLITNFRHPEESNPAKMIDRYLKELGTDYLDAVLVGAILTRNWATEDKWVERRDLLNAAKQSGRVRAHGVSVHGWEALQSVATDPWVDLAMVSCNHTGAWMDGPPDRPATEIERRDSSAPLIRAIHTAGIGTAAMKVFSHSGYRDAAQPAEERLKAIRYVLSLGAIDCLPILYESIDEFDEVTRMINLVGKELEVIG